MYLKLTNGQPKIYSIGQLHRENPQTSFPRQMPEELLSEYGVYTCARPEYPIFDWLTSRVVDGEFYQDASNGWFQGYVIENLFQDEAERNVRSHRDSLLQQTDWMALSDNTITPENAAYRQALRDITTQEGFPYNVVWPTKP
jgi:hypothetical protein